MSYDLYIDDKSVAQAASNSGWVAAAKYLEAHGGPESKMLAQTGYSDKPEALVKELRDLIRAEETPADIASTLRGIVIHSGKAKEHVGVSQEGPHGFPNPEKASERLAELKPHEKHHNFEGHAKRQDATSTAIRRIIGGLKPALYREAARRASHLSPSTLNSLTLPFDKALVARLSKSIGIAHQYGHDQVYAERYRATGKAKSERPVLTLTANRLHNRAVWQGLNISIENARGTVRKGNGHDGTPWATIMHYPYGYIRRKGNTSPENKGQPTTAANDNEHIDCYLGPDKKSKNVYIVHQNNPHTGKYDEDKVMLDFSSADDAKHAYLSHIPETWFGSMDTMTVEDFKKALEDNDGRLHTKLDQPKQTLAESADQDQPYLIAEAAVSDLNNAVTARTKAAAIDLSKQGLSDQELEDELFNEMMEGSDAYLDRIADEAARSGVAGGRWSAFEELEGEIGSWVRSEAMDKNTCDPCEEGDGTEWETLDDVDWSPGDDCEGDDLCRGQLMPVFADEGEVESE